MTLTPLLVSLSILAALGGMALPAWQSACTQALLKARAQSLIADTQWAQWQALRLGEPIELGPLPCPSSASALADWSCGWQVLRPNPVSPIQDQVLRQREFSPHIRMTPFASTTTTQSHWRFDAEGRWRMGAMRVEWQAQGRPGPATGFTVCVSNAGRWRWQTGLGCSS